MNSFHGKIMSVIFCLLLLSAGSVCAKEGVIRCANLIYAGTHTSRCFSDEFLSAIQRKTTISTERRFKSVKLASEELFKFPFVMITGESDFHFRSKEREKLKKYLTSGGFMLASAGCSSKAFDRAFRRELKAIFPDKKLEKIKFDHPIFQTVHEIKKLKLHHPGEKARLEGLTINDKLVAVYSPHGLNDTGNVEGCCCCGGNEIENALEVNVNILVYALMH